MSEQAPRTVQLAYTLGGVIYLPHYLRKDRFVKPGCSRSQPDTWTSKQLEAHGAKALLINLWPRKYS